MSALPPIERPNGKLYRPRKLTYRSLGEDEMTGVVVFGTQDPQVARAYIEPILKDIAEELYFDGMELLIVSEGEPVWYRQELQGFDDRRAIYSYTRDPERGRAGIDFDIHEHEKESTR